MHFCRNVYASHILTVTLSNAELRNLLCRSLVKNSQKRKARSNCEREREQEQVEGEEHWGP